MAKKTAPAKKAKAPKAPKAKAPKAPKEPKAPSAAEIAANTRKSMQTFDKLVKAGLIYGK